MTSVPAHYRSMRPPVALRVAVSLAVIVLMAWIRLGFFNHRTMPIAFAAPLAIFIWMMDRRFLWITVSVFAGAAVIKYFTLLPIYAAAGQPEDLATRMSNVALILLDLLVNAGVVHMLIGARGALRRRDIELVRANKYLATQTSVALENARLFSEVEHGRRRLATILESLPIGLAITNADLTDIRYNRAGAAMVGMPVNANIADQIARSIWIHSEDGKPIAFEGYPIVRATRGERVHPHEVEVVLATGRRITVLSSSSPFRDADGKIIGATSSFVDITQLKQLQRELETRRREAEEANIRKTRFLAAASHDIRTPANAISLLAELLKRTAGSPSMAAEIPQLAGALCQSATSLVNLVSNVLDVTRIDTDKPSLHETEFPIALLLEEESRQLIPLAQAKHLVLEVQPASEPIWIRADRIKLGRVIGNLMGNAIKFTDQGSVRVTIVRNPDGAICVAVADTGIGIAPDHLPHIFDEFWQLSHPGRSKGSGLGLSICERLVEAMGARISVQSLTGAGSTFAITLPASAIVARPGGEASPGVRR